MQDNIHGRAWKEVKKHRRQNDIVDVRTVTAGYISRIFQTEDMWEETGKARSFALMCKMPHFVCTPVLIRHQMVSVPENKRTCRERAARVCVCEWHLRCAGWSIARAEEGSSQLTGGSLVLTLPSSIPKYTRSAIPTNKPVSTTPS